MEWGVRDINRDAELLLWAERETFVGACHKVLRHTTTNAGV